MATIMARKFLATFRDPFSAVLKMSLLVDQAPSYFRNATCNSHFCRFLSTTPTLFQRCPIHQSITGSSLPHRLEVVSLCQNSLLYSTSHHPTQDSQIQADDQDSDDKLYKWIELKVKGHDDAVLESYTKYVDLAASELDITVDSITKPFRHIKKFTLLKSRHVYKKHRVQYEMRTYYRVIKLKHLTGSTASVFLEYIERNLPEGVAMQVKKCSIQALPNHLQSPPEVLEDVDQTSSSSSSSSDSDDDMGASTQK